MNSSTDSFSASADTMRMFSTTIMKVSRQELMQHLNEAGIDLPLHQFGVLHCMKGQTLTLTEVSHKMGLDPSTLAPVIESLVRRGCVQRNRDPQDRRRVPLTLTHAGSELLTQGTCLNERSLLAKGLAQIGEEKSQQLVSLLDEFVTCLTDLANDASTGETNKIADERGGGEA